MTMTVHLRPELGGHHFVATLADLTSYCRSCDGTVDAPRSQHAPPRAELAARGFNVDGFNAPPPLHPLERRSGRTPFVELHLARAHWKRRSAAGRSASSPGSIEVGKRP